MTSSHRSQHSISCQRTKLSMQLSNQHRTFLHHRWWPVEYGRRKNHQNCKNLSMEGFCEHSCSPQLVVFGTFYVHRSDVGLPSHKASSVPVVKVGIVVAAKEMGIVAWRYKSSENIRLASIRARSIAYGPAWGEDTPRKQARIQTETPT